MEPDESRIHVLSLNCWSVFLESTLTSTEIYIRGLKFIAKNLDERIEAIAHYLASANYDIIALQEIWVFAHYERIRQRVSSRLPHSKFFYRCVTFLVALENRLTINFCLISVVR